jgi:hypothetical protein
MDSREWNKFLPSDYLSREGWDYFYENIHKCKINRHMLKFLLQLNESHKIDNIFLITAREDIGNVRKDTVEQLNSMLFKFMKRKWKWHLYMRNCCDFRTSSEVKKSIITQNIYPYHFIDLAIDDDKENIEMYKNFNIMTKLYKIGEE